MPRGSTRESRPEDCATAWFALLERSRIDGDREREAMARRNLNRLGVRVDWRDEPSPCTEASQ